MLFREPVRQIAYYVKDVREAARRHSLMYGSGPYLVLPPLSLPARHRGQKADLDLTVALGQWGTMQVEFIHHNKSGDKSAFRDVFPEGSNKYGFHHVAMFVDSVKDAVAYMEKLGHKVASEIDMPDGSPCVYVDAFAEFGQYVEMYERTPLILGMYERVEKLAEGFDGKDPVRDFKFD
jgi:hypothetical protein